VISFTGGCRLKASFRENTAIGSKIMKKLLADVLVLGIITGCATDSGSKVAETKRETLAVHETRAEFLGIEEHVCRGLTALCPDRCGHSGKLATFRIVEYIRFESFSEYGRKQEHFQVLIRDNLGNLKVDPMVADAVARFSPGDIVRLSWNHDYVEINGLSGPERPVTKLEREFK
jgi:hypothetical protein